MRELAADATIFDREGFIVARNIPVWSDGADYRIGALHFPGRRFERHRQALKNTVSGYWIMWGADDEES